MLGRRTSAVFAFVLLLSSCRNPDSSQSALKITVRLGQDLKATCVRVFAIAEGGEERVGEGVKVGDKRELVVALYASEDLGGTVQVGARGFVGDGCADASLNEESAVVRATFKPGEVTPVTVALAGVPAAADADGDGWRANTLGGADCDDSSAQVYPGAPELCGDALDNDCNGAADCAEPSCDGQSCSDGNVCTAGEVCAQGACGMGTQKTCDVAPTECLVAPGVCTQEAGGCSYTARTGEACDGGTCRADGTCVDSSIEADCQNGLDDDNNNLIDCMDPDCDLQPCSDGNVCTTASVCMNQACASGQPVTCTMPTTDCFEPVGACGMDGGCAYTPKPSGSACSAGECRGDGGCGPSEAGALCQNGVDDDGDGLTDCMDTSCNGSTCEDGNLCTTGETCQGTTCAGGATLTCNMPPPCFVLPATCEADAGCQYTVNAGATCPNGFCDANGACLPPFPYAPANFNPLDYGPASRGGSYQFDCGTSEFNSTAGIGSPFTNWCGQTPPPVFTVMQANGVEAVVLPVSGLTVEDGNTLSIYGARPVIFAIYGNATIESGTALVQAGADRTVPGPGGDHAACGAATGKPGQTGGRGGGGGGGSFGTVGGAGGAGYDDTPRGDRGVLPQATSLSPLVGGCAGGAGGNSGGAGGGGGGAVQFSASGTLTVNGRITTRGGGGAGAVNPSGGGGGGGSGGAILLEGNAVAFGSNAILSANGGGGGEGKGPQNPGTYDGEVGDNGYYVSGSAAAGGDFGTCQGGNGGAGAYASSVAAVDGSKGTACFSDNGGGGGGGGGSGRIHVNASTGCTGVSSGAFRAVTTSTGQNCP